MSEKEEKILNYLISLVNEMGSSMYLSLFNPREQSVCINKNEEENLWEVYMVERGLVFELTVYDDIYDACICVLRHLSYDKEDYIKQKNKFSEVKKLIKEE